MSALPAASLRLSPALARVLPFALFIGLLALQSLVGDRAGDLRWLTVLRPLLVAILLGVLWRHYEELHVLRLPWRHAALAAGVGIAVFATWIAFDRGWAATGSSSGGFAPLDDEGGIDVTLAALRLLGFGLVVPVMEELFWRSFLLRWIEGPADFLAVDPRKVGFVAFGLTSALFAAEHSLWFAGLLAGVAYNFAYMRTRNLWAAVVSHAITNITLGVWILGTGHWRLW